MIIWFTGLSGAGKSTLSDYLKIVLEKAGFSVCQVDGDLFREKNKHAHFSREAIVANNQKIIAHCQEIEDNYDVVIVAVISPYQETRELAKKTLGKSYCEVFLDCPLAVVVKNDVKGLYKKSQAGQIKNMIGFHENSPYEIPQNPDIIIKTNETVISESVEKIIKKLQESY